MPNLSIRVFGYPRLLLDGVPLKMERRKTLALAAYLAVEGARREISREQIATLLWPDCYQDQAGAYLRQALWDFAKAAGDSWIAREEQTLLFKPDADLWVDVRAFSIRLAEWKAGEALRSAAIPLLSELAGFYQGDFLAGFNLRDCPAFDEWQVYQAETYRLQLGHALEALVKAHTSGINHYQAVEYARRWLALDPLNEEAHLALMQLYANQGQRSAALQQYESLTRVLADELGVEPGAETTAFFEHIRDAVSMPDSAAAKPRPVSLPAQMTPFVGREEELARIADLLHDPDCRLISLVGIGGSGKTRLSIQAAGISQGFPDGVFFVGLAVVNSFEQLLAAIAETLKVAFHNEPGSNLKLEDAKIQLMNHLAARQLLLVLDNFEQLSPWTNFLAELLDSSPGLKIIVTTRERLNLRGETVVEVGGLAFPENLENTRADHFSAVQLFIKSAARVGRFHPVDADWPVIVRVCELVEGIPLGIEMAAGWTRMLSCTEIAAEIERDLDFLQASLRGMPERQSTFRAIFEYSWRLLSAKDRSTFCRLSIFQGDFNRTAALEVASASLAALTSLVDKSMLRRLSSGRFEIHPVLRQYAAEKLAEAPDIQADTRQRYAVHYSNWLLEQFRQLKGSQHFAALTALRGETQNLYAAWRILVEAHDVERLKAGLPAVILFNVMNDHRIEMQEFTGLLLDMISWLQGTQSAYDAQGAQDAAGSAISESLPNRTAINELHALTLAAYRHFTIDYSRPEPTIPYLEKSQKLIQDIPENSSKAFVLLLNSISPGILFRKAAIETAQQSYTIFRHLNDTWGSALAQMIYADGLTFGNLEYTTARSEYQASLELFTNLENDWGRALCLSGLSYVEQKTGNLRMAFQLARQSLEMLDRLDNQERTTQTRLFVANIAEELGDLDSARLYHTLNRTRSVQRGEERHARYFQERLDLLEKNQIGTHIRPPSER